ncbi:tail fiber domain-containing protein [Burkholderia cepacia]|uniref:Chaperone of endosialidase family protein n=1 Tax=Burkholderia cepacia TaxID=292 RepID=A0AA89CK14_BURCE|nr:tail fiber domain-containing protein [Burkholderia cepacia]KGB99773.1 chaperone of endosialidase family protein [Burkholderia cepacia]
MPQLQKANLGSAPNGDGGDDQRTANVRYNANVDVLAACVALGYTILGDNSTIKSDQVGVRFGLNIGVPGKKIVLPLAGSVMVNACVHFFNVGVGVDIGLQGSDGTQTTTLAHGDWITYASDGVAYWHVVARGKMLPDEVVSGFLSVSRGLSVGGDVAIGGRLNSVNSPNLLPNSTGELRNQCWSGTNFGVVSGTSGEGTVFINSAAINTAGYAMDYSDNIAIGAGMQLILSAEIATNGLNSGQVYMKVESFNASGTLLGTFATSPISTKRDYAFMTASGKTPNGTSYVRVSRVADNAPNIAQWGVAFRRIKLERGASPSLYSQEASLLYLQGAPAFAGRPTFGGNVPWDSWNLQKPWHAGNFDPGNYAPLSGNRRFVGGGTAFDGWGIHVSGSAPWLEEQGVALSWNDDVGKGQGFLTTNRGAGIGGWILRTISQDARQEIGRFVVNPDGSYGQSDKRLKRDIRTIPNALERIRKIRGVSYVRRSTGAGSYGVIANEVRKHFPWAVSEIGAGKGKEHYLGVNYQALVAPLIEAAKELADRVERLEGELAQLKGETQA